MSPCKWAFAQLFMALPALLTTAHAFAEDGPVEKPAVGRPALPQGAVEEPTPVEHPSTARPSRARPVNYGGGTTDSTARGESRSTVYFGPGIGLLSGLGGGKYYQRSNVGITGLVGIELPVGERTGVGFEVDGDLELTGSGERSSYSDVLFRVRLGKMFTPSTRLWAAAGVGAGGHLTTDFVGAIAVGSTLLLAPKFGLDLSANLSVLGREAQYDYAGPGGGVPTDYTGGAVLFLAVRAMFELHKGH